MDLDVMGWRRVRTGFIQLRRGHVEGFCDTTMNILLQEVWGIS
jgi:hypothetical protein